MMRTFTFFIASFLFLGTTFAYGASDTFTITTLIGSDTTAPSIPGSLGAVPVATTQIDVSWASSTDDMGVSGYHVYRNGVHIATTTAVLYSDVGLTASTTYTYYVTAFDSSNNFSASSTEVSTTTLTDEEEDEDEDDDSQSGSGSKLPELVSIEIIPSQNGVHIRYETRGYVRGVTKWGETFSYELGSSAERSFSQYHEVVITDLSPGTTYRLIIEGETRGGRRGILTETSFETVPAADTIPSGNVMNLRANIEDGAVVLTWTNPEDSDFDRVRIVRSNTFYPTDIADGWVVYEGGNERAVDESPLGQGEKRYYTVFTYDNEGNISSGAVVLVGSTISADLPDITNNPIALTFSDLEFYQDNVLVSPNGPNSVFIHGGRHLTIALPYDRVPEHLKTILVTLTPHTEPDKILSFLLRINADKTAYTARIAPLGVAGTFDIRVSVFDYETAQIGYTEGTLRSLIRVYEDEENDVVLIGITDWLFHMMTTNYMLILILLFFLFLVLSRRRLHARE